MSPSAKIVSDMWRYVRVHRKQESNKIAHFCFVELYILKVTNLQFAAK